MASDVDLVLGLGVLPFGLFRLRQGVSIELSQRVESPDERLHPPRLVTFLLGLGWPMLDALLERNTDKI